MKINKHIWKGSILLIISFGIFSFLHFLFQLFMARNLSISEYGTLSALFSIIYIALVFTESIQTLITKYSSDEKNNGKLKNIFFKFIKKISKLSLYIFGFYLVMAIILSYILKINYFLLAITGLVIFTATFTPISRGIMQGRRKFKSLGINLVIESSLKLILGMFFVLLGWKVYGAITGVILGGFISFIYSFVQLKEIVKSKEIKSKMSGVYAYAKPTFILTFIIVLFYSLDVLLAKILFSPEKAGYYAIASILGKIIFWGTLPISKAMFPESAEKNKSKSELNNIFGNALTILLSGIIFTLVLFYLFPDLIIQIFSGKNAQDASKILLLVGIAFSLISLANLNLLYKLSVNKIRNYKLMFIFILIEIILLVYFSENLVQFSIAFIVSSAAFLWGSIRLMNS